LIRWKTDSVTPAGKVEGHFEPIKQATFEEQARILGVEL